MSLTSHLSSPDSPIRSYVHEAFPIIEQSKRGALFAKQFSALLNLDNLPSCRLPTLAPKANQGTIGTAVDYRLRYYFQSYDAHGTAAGHAVRMLGGSLGALGSKFLDYQNELVSRIGLAGRVLADKDEAALNANCIILALFDQIYRMSGENHPLLDALPRRAKLDDLVALVRADEVQDINQLSLAFAADAKALFKGKAILNPIFKGSEDIGGADGDIIIENTLIELKCAAKIDATKLRAAALQLLGYVLLDYDDDYTIAELMVYLPRQRCAWRLPITMCVLSPSDLLLHTTGRTTRDMDALTQPRLRERRREFRKLVESLR